MLSIREIREEDNPAIAKVIRSVLLELGVPKVGTAYADPELDCLTKAYEGQRSCYFVVEQEGRVIGGAGISPLAGEEPSICELQKMYFLPQARGLGVGEKMIHQCLEFARANNYELCYIETLPYMKAAQKLYRKVGFNYIQGPMGNTGHTTCNVWLTKPLK